MKNDTAYAAAGSVNRRYVLVVDNEIRSLFYTTTLLQRFCYRVITARSGAEALDIIDTVVPALIIVAAGHLEDMPCDSFIHLIQQRAGEGTIPLIVLGSKS